MTMGDRLWALLVAVTLLVAGCGGDGRNAAESQGSGAVPTVLILDASGSMNESDAPGPRIDAAKRAAQGLVDGLPDGTSTALLAYGTSTGSTEAEKATGCQDVKVLIPMGALDREQMAARISGLSASGYTPISLALRTAMTQLPAGDDPQAIILVSDGEDTCGAPPCDTAKEAQQKYPNVAISTIGFKTEGNASDQLRCIAEVTGGLFVHADNANQLAARLLATQNIEQAQNSLSSNGIGDITLGTNLGDIRKVHRDFPNAATSGSVTVVYRDCDFGFVDGVLDSIAPHGGGRTIDGVTAGTPLARVIELYGKPLTTETNGSGSYRLTFAADPATDAGYRVTVGDYTDTAGTITGTVQQVVLCRCTPRATSSGNHQMNQPEIVMVEPVDAHGNVQPGWAQDESRAGGDIYCSDASVSPYAKTSGVRSCGVPGMDTCWPGPDDRHLQCSEDPFTKVVYLTGVRGLSSSIKPSSTEPSPFALELDDGNKCRVRRSGTTWTVPRENQEWVGYFSCDHKSVYGPQGQGVEKGPDGWKVSLYPSDGSGSAEVHKVVKVYYAGVAGVSRPEQQPAGATIDLVDPALFAGVGGENYYFVSPSGKWNCGISRGGVGRGFAGCHGPEVGDDLPVAGAPLVPHHYDDHPTAPNNILVDQQSARFISSGNPLFWPPTGRAPRVLEYGQTLSVLGFTCNTQRSGISCRNDSTGKGFTFSSNGYKFEYTPVP